MHSFDTVELGVWRTNLVTCEAIERQSPTDSWVDITQRALSGKFNAQPVLLVMDLQLSALQKHPREAVYNVCGNHDRSGLNEPQAWWWRKWVDPTGKNTAHSRVHSERRPYPIEGRWERYSFRVGNILFLMMGDINEPTQTIGRGDLGGNPGAVDIWLGGHTHPDDTYGGKAHVETKWGPHPFHQCRQPHTLPRRHECAQEQTVHFHFGTSRGPYAMLHAHERVSSPGMVRQSRTNTDFVPPVLRVARNLLRFSGSVLRRHIVSSLTLALDEASVGLCDRPPSSIPFSLIGLSKFSRLRGPDQYALLLAPSDPALKINGIPVRK